MKDGFEQKHLTWGVSGLHITPWKFCLWARMGQIVGKNVHFLGSVLARLLNMTCASFGFRTTRRVLQPLGRCCCLQRSSGWARRLQ